MKTMYAITHLSPEYGRKLTFANQGRNHYETREEAEKALVLYAPDLRAKILGDLADTLKVIPIECYDHGDAKRSVFLTDESVFEDFDHVACPQCFQRVSSPFQASGLERGKGGVWRGQCSGRKGCGAMFTFDLVKK